MKYFAIASLSLICLSLAATTSVQATTNISNESKSIAMMIAIEPSSQITPFQLVSLAYQGTYRSEGIPGFASLIFGYHYRQITAKDVIKAAIAAKQLTPATLTDRDYVSAVDLQLFSLDRPD
ncbi:hypothetical protein [Chamaesiphon sp.]|uniref:hypothetical protein n=1 Tax=Chamaesiphon sp. TaxID=2814140 RepID=UPI0035938509